MKELLEALIEENANTSSDEKIPMKGNTFTYMNPGFTEILKDLNKEAKEVSKEEKSMEKENKKTEVFKGMPKDKVVFASFVCEHIFRDENNFDSYVEFLGIFTDPEKAEKACDESKKGWIPITSNITPENKIFYKIKGDYYFNKDLMFLTIKNRIVLSVELNNLNIKENFMYCNSINQKTYMRIVDMFKRYKEEQGKCLSNLENGIHELFVR